MRARDEQGRPVELTAIAGGPGGNVAAVLLSDRGMVVVRGDVLHGTDTPDGEAVVEAPIEALLEAARAVL